MERLWTDLEVCGRLMVSDFTRLHCEDDCASGLRGDEIVPGAVVPGLGYYCRKVEVLKTDPIWVQLRVGDKTMTVLSGQKVKGPDTPLSYAYGETHIHLIGERIPALKILDEMEDPNMDLPERYGLYKQLMSLVEQGDPWAAFLAAEALLFPPYMPRDDKENKEAATYLSNRLKEILETSDALDPVKDRVADYLKYLQRHM